VQRKIETTGGCGGACGGKTKDSESVKCKDPKHVKTLVKRVRRSTLSIQGRLSELP